ncbi:MAG: PEP/pyruvate-binding domain-containing protein, partial [Methanobacterium sp.]
MDNMMNNRYVMDVDAVDPEIEKIGGKALNLGKMSRAGFNIPPAFVVSVDAYDLFIKNELEGKISKILNSIDFTSESSISYGCYEIRSMIKDEKLPQDLFLEIKNKIMNLPDGCYAVRSSAVAEDLADASFAGQLDSFLNVKRDDILEKVIHCWASYWNDRAVKYRHDSSIGHLDSEIGAAGIAVVIQKMVNAEVSGVIFTANPVNGSDEIVIESTWGLGEAIASGMVTPDIFVLKRDGEITQKHIKTKEKGYFPGKNSLTSIDEENRQKSSLNEKTLSKLLNTGIELEEFFGSPQDIEWAIECMENTPQIYILQSRPVTTLQDKDDILWTRAYGDEYWADATTPLFYDVMGKMLTDYVNHEGARIMGYKEITDTELLK